MEGFKCARQVFCYPVFLLLVDSVLKGRIVSAVPTVVFSPHQYAVLDSTITFTAKVLEPDHDKYKIYWSETRWASIDPRLLTAELNKTNGFQSDWLLDFPKERYYAGNYAVSANIIYEWGPFSWEVEVATQLLGFTLTQNFTGALSVNHIIRQKSKSPILVSTKNETVIEVVLDSPGILDKATNVSWTWFNGSEAISNVTGPILKYNFTEAKIYTITAKLEATFNNTLKANETTVKEGNFSTTVAAKVPIINVNISGDTWYRDDGRLLRITITCDGTGPYRYCLILKEGSYNISGDEKCPSVEATNDCEIPFAWLLGEGIHTLITIMENDLGRYINQTAIHVYKVARVQPLSLILVPITCSLIALVLIIFGIGYFWENRKRYVVEVADFDFGQHDELPYMTFLERLRDAMSSTSVDRQRLIPPPDEEPTLSTRRSSEVS